MARWSLGAVQEKVREALPGNSLPAGVLSTMPSVPDLPVAILFFLSVSEVKHCSSLVFLRKSCLTFLFLSHPYVSGVNSVDAVSLKSRTDLQTAHRPETTRRGAVSSQALLGLRKLPLRAGCSSCFGYCPFRVYSLVLTR